jgi:hypothetical protein
MMPRWPDWDGDDETHAGRDLKLDPWLFCSGPRLQEVAMDLFMDTEMRRPASPRRPRRDAENRRRLIVDNLVASLTSQALQPSVGRGLMVSTKNDPLTRYDRHDFPRQVVAEKVHALSETDWLILWPGSHHGPRSTINPSRKFKQRLAQSGITLDEVGRLVGGETIILKARAPDRSLPKPLIDYRDTAETRRLREELEAIRDFLTSADITVDGLPLAPYQLTRQFLIDSPQATPTFARHGRLYGGPWINMHRDQRYRLRIDGEELADLDFTAMFTQLAYLRAGAGLPEGDPYDGVPGLELSRIPDTRERAQRRQAIKQGLNALYSRQGRMSRMPHEIKEQLGPDWTGAKLEAALRERHAPIQHLFGIGIALDLAFIESNVLMCALRDLMANGVAALPVHDGIMVPVSKQDLALAAMRSASRAVVGVELPVKAKPLPRPALAGLRANNSPPMP